jgi:hypothetical protein
MTTLADGHADHGLAHAHALSRATAPSLPAAYQAQIGSAPGVQQRRRP